MIVIFIDGLGIGPPDPTCNPLAHFAPRVLRVSDGNFGPFPADGAGLVMDVSMGVPGLPQSATGQTALWTGVNAADLIGRHLTGFPNIRLREVIAEHSVFLRLKDRGLRPAFANCFSPDYFERPPRWKSVTTVMCETARVPLLNFEDLVRRRAVYFDLTNERLVRKGLEIDIWTARDAALALVGLAADCDLCLYEFFLTDLEGHRGTLTGAIALLRLLDEFLAHVLDHLELDQSLLIVSDHGNIENMDQKQHTENAVPAIFWGPIREEVRGLRHLSILDVTPIIERHLLPKAP